MFLDEHTIWPRREDPAPLPRSRRERVMARFLLLYAFILLLMPVSLGSAADLVRYLIGLLG